MRGYMVNNHLYNTTYLHISQQFIKKKLKKKLVCTKIRHINVFKCNLMKKMMNTIDKK